MASSSCSVAREKGLICSCFDECTDTLCLFPENCTSFEHFLQVKIFIILSYLIYFDQGKHSCPGASCPLYNDRLLSFYRDKKEREKNPPPLLKLQIHGQYFSGAAIPRFPSSVNEKLRTFAILGIGKRLSKYCLSGVSSVWWKQLLHQWD